MSAETSGQHDEFELLFNALNSLKETKVRAIELERELMRVNAELLKYRAGWQSILEHDRTMRKIVEEAQRRASAAEAEALRAQEQRDEAQRCLNSLSREIEQAIAEKKALASSLERLAEQAGKPRLPPQFQPVVTMR